MKKIYSILALALLSLGAAAQQIPNNSFETWADPFGMGEEPEGFITFDFISGDNVMKSTDANTGSFSAQLITTYAPNDTLIVQDSLGNPTDTIITEMSSRGTMINGSLDLSTFEMMVGMPYNGQPTQLRFWAKANLAADDTAGVVVSLTKFNASLGESEAVGGAAGMLLGNIPMWTMIEVPFVYDQAVAPDTIFVLISSNFDNEINGDGEIFIDDITLVYAPTSVTEVNTFNASLYPNPSNGLVNLTGASLNGCLVQVVDVTGRVINTVEAAGQSVQLDIATSGIYFVTATNPNGEVVFRKKITVQ